MAIANVEDDEIVIRIPLSALVYPPEPRGFEVVDPQQFAPHVAVELSGEDMAERPWIEGLVEGAILRAAEADAPGLRWEEEINPGRATLTLGCPHYATGPALLRERLRDLMAQGKKGRTE